ncbi:MAG TPA: hypothetical protein PK264_14295, partial [Hyphomicrobiaceae bacterium]|nr:hypothetical protein [Hyphomicrobiaceae bacterium]
MTPPLTIAPSIDLAARPREACFLSLDLKAAVGADGAFEGYASLFDREDLGRDVVTRGAFRDSLAERGAAGVRMLVVPGSVRIKRE